MIIQISAGQGPPECQLAVGKLYAALQKEYGDLEWLSETRGEEKGCYDSIRFRTEHDLSGASYGYVKVRFAEITKEKTGMWT